jgi:hypothetical protein
MFPIVDVSDTTMAASGTTKRISINNILACSPTATLASATITGDLTAARLIVTGGTIPTNGLWLPTTNTLEFAANSLAQYRIAPLGVFSWFDGAGGTRMTLDSTGLGIGSSPTEKLTVWGTPVVFGDGRFNVGLFDPTSATTGTGSGISLGGYTNGVTVGAAFAQIKGIKENSTAGNIAGAFVVSIQGNGGSPVERLRIDSVGNLILQSSATPATLTTNGQLTVNATSNTNLRFSYRGSDGTTRVANITLA